MGGKERLFGNFESLLMDLRHQTPKSGAAGKLQPFKARVHVPI